MPTNNRLRFLLAALVLGALLLVVLNGCSAMPDTWDEYPTLKPLPAVVMRVSAQEVTERCGRKGVMGCAIRDYKNGVCVIYVDLRPLPETIPHELLHCAGYDHGR